MAAIRTRRGPALQAPQVRRAQRHQARVHERRAARRERERTIVSAALGEQLSTTETFGEWFDTWLANRRPYLEPGTYSDYEIHGRLRLARLRPRSG